MERSNARRGCVTMCVCLCVCMLVLLSMETCCGVSAPAAGVVPCCIVGICLVQVLSWCPWTPCWRSWSPSGWSRRWQPAPEWTRYATEIPTSAATSRPRGSSAERRRRASQIASAHPASQTPALLSSPSPAETEESFTKS